MGFSRETRYTPCIHKTYHQNIPPRIHTYTIGLGVRLCLWEHCTPTERKRKGVLCHQIREVHGESKSPTLMLRDDTTECKRPFAAFFFGRRSVTASTKKGKCSGDYVLPREKPRVCMNIRIYTGRNMQR